MLGCETVHNSFCMLEVVPNQLKIRCILIECKTVFIKNPRSFCVCTYESRHIIACASGQTNYKLAGFKKLNGTDQTVTLYEMA